MDYLSSTIFVQKALFFEETKLHACNVPYNYHTWFSQMAPNLSEIRVLATLSMSNFALEAREEYTGHVNGFHFRFDFAKVNTLRSSFFSQHVSMLY